MITSLRTLFILLLATLFAAPVPAAEPVRFAIESIVIEGLVHASPRIIVAESRLREGQTYTEPELRDAIARIDRLPFVLSSEFRLAKGSVPGTYALIVTIRETKPLFISALSRSYWTTSLRITGPIRPPAPPVYEEFSQDFHNYQATVGGRWFAGSKGMAYVAADVAVSEVYVRDEPHYSTAWRYNAGFTQYDLFGTRASLTALVSYRNRKIRGVPGFDNDLHWRSKYDLTYQLVGAVPVGANRSITGSWEWHTDPITYAGPQGLFTPLHTRPVHLDQQQLAWRYDTTDDPLFPTSGSLLRAGITRLEYAYYDNNAVRHRRSNRNELLGADRFWSITPLQSVSAGVEYERFSYDTIRPRLGYSASLWGRARTLKAGDLRAEAEVSDYIVDPFKSSRRSNARLRAGLAFRNEWGVIRADFYYDAWRSR